MKTMVDKIKIKCIHCGHVWWTRSQAVNVCCGSCGRKTPARTRPDKPIVAPPPALKQRVKVRIGQLPDGSTIVGEVLSKPTGRTILCETLEVPSARNHTQPIEFKPSSTHTMRLLKGSEIDDVCSICGKKLFDDLRFNVLLDNEKKCHSSCVAESAVLSSGGDLGQASAVWGIPYDVLYKK